MGGHAVRYYGLQRHTDDVDLHLAPDCWDDLSQRLAQSSLFANLPVIEGPTWRPGSFRRFQVGVLAGGREEWLEFWRRNHLLAPFADLYSRREQGAYGGRTISFLSLADLIRSKETERETDWQDVAYLEEFLDARLLGQLNASRLDPVETLSALRSRRGFEALLQQNHLHDPNRVEAAIRQTTLSITQAYLLPCAPKGCIPPPATVPIEPVVLERLRTAVPGSRLHLSLVEIVRRQYKMAAQTADRKNKEAIRGGDIEE
jgi:hypothetical protein